MWTGLAFGLAVAAVALGSRAWKMFEERDGGGSQENEGANEPTRIAEVP
jgi:hypothetical protein